MFGDEWVTFVAAQTTPVRTAISDLIPCNVLLDSAGHPIVTIKGGLGLSTWAAKRPFALARSTGGPWVSKLKGDQDTQLLIRFSERAAAAMAGPDKQWCKLTRNDADEWFRSHVKTDVVRLQLLVFTDVKWTSKVDAIPVLLDREVGPIPFQLARLLYLSIGNPAVAQATLVSSFPDAAFTTEVVVEPPAETPAAAAARTAAAELRLATEALDAARARQAAALTAQTLGSAHTPPGSPERQPTTPGPSHALFTAADLAQITAQILSEFGRSKTPTSPAALPAAPAESRYDTFIASLHKKVCNFEFINIAELSPEALRAAREKLCSASMQKLTHSTVAGLPVVHEIPTPEFKSKDDQYWLSGFDEYVRILSSDTKTAHRVSDILSWRVQVFSTRNVSTAQKIVYAKEFMFTYRGHAHANAWCEKFATDHVLRGDFLLKESSSKPSKYSDAEKTAYSKSKKDNAKFKVSPRGRRDRGAARNQVGDGTPYSRRRSETHDRGQSDRRGRDTERNDRDRSDRNDRGGTRDRSDRAQQTANRPCRSRVGRNEQCTYGDKCKFSHKCIFCDNKTHAAQDCPNWTTDKAEAANSKFNMRIQL
jgi:hypothetical protein